MKKDTIRKKSYEYERAIAALAIVFLHTFQSASELGDTKGFEKIASVVIRNCSMWAVPVFIMVTGALLLDPNRDLSYKKLFDKYISRTIIIIILCAVGTNIVDGIMLGEYSFTGISFLRNVVCDLWMGLRWKELWYLYLLLAIYLSISVCRNITKNISEKEAKTGLAILFVFQSMVPLISELSGVESGFYIFAYTIFPLYLFLGDAIAGKRMFFKLKNTGWIIAGIVLTFVLEIGIIIACFRYNLTSLFAAMGLYSTPIIVIQTFLIFSLFECFDFNKLKDSLIERIVRAVDRCTLEIYVIHLFVLKIIMGVTGFNPVEYGMGAAMLFAIGVFIISWMLGMLTKALK